MGRRPSHPQARRCGPHGGRDAIVDGRDASVTDGSVKLALRNRAPTSPKGFMILGLSIMLGCWPASSWRSGAIGGLELRARRDPHS